MWELSENTISILETAGWYSSSLELGPHPRQELLVKIWEEVLPKHLPNYTFNNKAKEFLAYFGGLHIYCGMAGKRNSGEIIKIKTDLHFDPLRALVNWSIDSLLRQPETSILGEIDPENALLLMDEKGHIFVYNYLGYTYSIGNSTEEALESIFRDRFPL